MIESSIKTRLLKLPVILALAATFTACFAQQRLANQAMSPRESALRRELAQHFSPETGLELAGELVALGKTKQALCILAFLKRQDEEGAGDARVLALLAECQFMSGRLCDCVETLGAILERYPQHRGWVEDNFDVITRRISRKSAQLRTTGDERRALRMIAAMGPYPGPCKLLCAVYERQINDPAAAQMYRVRAARAERDIALRNEAAKRVMTARLIEELFRHALARLSAAFAAPAGADL